MGNQPSKVQFRKLVTLVGHRKWVSSVAFHPNRRFMATGSWDGNVRVWRLTDDGAVWVAAIGQSHSHNVLSFAFDPTGQFLATADGYTATVKRMSAYGTAATSVATLVGHSLFVNSVAFDPSGRFLATGSNDATAKVWRLSPDSAVCVATLVGHRGSVTCVAFDPTGRFVATGSADNTAKVWRLNGLLSQPALLRLYQTTRKQLDNFFPRRYPFRFYKTEDIGVVVASIRLRLVAGGRLCATVASRLLCLPGQDSIGSAHILARAIVSRLHFFYEASCAATLVGHSDIVYSVAFHPTAPLLATGSSDRTAKVWRMSPDGAATTCVATLVGHSDFVQSVAFDPTGRFLATGSDDKTAKVWRMSPDGAAATCVATLEGHTDTVFSVAFDPTGRFLATGSVDKTAIVWEMLETEAKDAGLIIPNFIRNMTRGELIAEFIRLEEPYEGLSHQQMAEKLHSLYSDFEPDRLRSSLEVIYKKKKGGSKRSRKIRRYKTRGYKTRHKRSKRRN
jgi:WD40 repeat protein